MYAYTMLRRAVLRTGFALALVALTGGSALAGGYGHQGGGSSHGGWGGQQQTSQYRSSSMGGHQQRSASSWGGGQHRQAASSWGGHGRHNVSWDRHDHRGWGEHHWRDRGRW